MRTLYSLNCRLILGIIKEMKLTSLIAKLFEIATVWFNPLLAEQALYVLTKVIEEEKDKAELRKVLLEGKVDEDNSSLVVNYLYPSHLSIEEIISFLELKNWNMDVKEIFTFLSEHDQYRVVELLINRERDSDFFLRPRCLIGC
ncbi:hypothetical protein ACFQY3_24680 [Paenibacillus farraposensis]|uniref:hypothetical protein n=1 Tax=Paenibacillus farraposensis TaxID=2807095 RepID=UPI0036079C3E